MNAVRGLLLPRSPAALIGMAAAVANAALRVAVVPVFVTPLFDRVLANGDVEALPGVLTVAAAVVVAGSLALLLQDAALGRAAANVTATWRERAYRSLLARTPGRLPGSSGGLASRIVADLKEIEIYYQYGLGSLVAETCTLLGVGAVLFAANATATVYLVAMAVPLVVILGWVGRAIGGVSGRAQERTEAIGGHLQEGLKHHDVVRAFRAEGFMVRRFDQANRHAARAVARRNLLAAIPVPLSQTLLFAALGVLVTVLARSAADGRMTVGEVVGYVTLVALLATPSQLLPRAFALLRQAGAASKRLAALVAVEEAPVGATATGTVSALTADTVSATPVAPAAGTGPSGHGGLALDRVVFGYDEQDPVLADTSATLPARGLVAVTGESGAGKTTLLRLLLRFLHPTHGTVTLAGRSLEGWSEAELRGRVAYVPQDAAMLSGSVRDNLTLGRDFDDEALWVVLERADLAEVVRALPGDLSYPLREDGAGLSGGQRQRLALARALLSAPNVLLLDEPSANLDEASEAVLVRTIRREAQDRLVVVVAHRPALVAAADQVWRLEAGTLRPETAGA
ncbi:MAG: ABC transporter ATP-binding protein [Trueperaceae bacterium]